MASNISRWPPAPPRQEQERSGKGRAKNEYREKSALDAEFAWGAFVRPKARGAPRCRTTGTTGCKPGRRRGGPCVSRRGVDRRPRSSRGSPFRRRLRRGGYARTRREHRQPRGRNPGDPAIPGRLSELRTCQSRRTERRNGPTGVGRLHLRQPQPVHREGRSGGRDRSPLRHPDGGFPGRGDGLVWAHRGMDRDRRRRILGNVLAPSGGALSRRQPGHPGRRGVLARDPQDQGPPVLPRLLRKRHRRGGGRGGDSRGAPPGRQVQLCGGGEPGAAEHPRAARRAVESRLGGGRTSARPPSSRPLAAARTSSNRDRSTRDAPSSTGATPTTGPATSR